MGRKAAVMDAVTKSVEAEIKPVEDSAEHPNGEFVLILSKDNLDRDDENLWADEWMHPLPHKIHMDTDHAFAKGLSVPHTAGSGVPEITEDGDLLVKGTYAGTPHGQLTRQLVKEGHIWQASVSYQTHMLDDGRMVRELLNGTFTGVPANPEAVVLMSKEAKDSKGGTRYADPGYQEDKQPRYPIDTAEHVRAALAYFGQQKNRALYSPKQQAEILGRIKSRARALGIKVSDDSKALLWALTKAITMKNGKEIKGLPGILDLTQSTPARTIANDDVGARSVYDDDYPGGDTDDDGDGDVDYDPGDDLLQAVHDAAVALGACCDDDDMKSIHRLFTTLKDVASSTDGASAGILSNFVATPVNRGWEFVVAGPPGKEMYTLMQNDEVFGHGLVEDLKSVVKTKSSEADGEDDKDEEDSSEDTDDEEKSDSSDTKSYELTLADGSTVIIDGSKLKAIETKRAVGEGETIPNIAEKSEEGNANTEPDGSAEPSVDAQSVAASGAKQDDIDKAHAADKSADSDTKAAESVETKSADKGADADKNDVEKKSVTPGDLAAKNRLRLLTLTSKLAESAATDDAPNDKGAA